jgi:thiol:disulfide interchange protein DsbA
LKIKNFRLSYVILVMLILPLIACADSQQEKEKSPAATANFEEGVHYVELFQPLLVDSPSDKIEVADVFWYGCPHCYQLEPGLQKWKKTIPEDVNVVAIPAVMNPSWGLHAKAFYAAEAIGVLDKVHVPLFQALHEQGRRISSEDALLRFYASQGVDEAKLKAAMGSMAVATKVRRAEKFGSEADLTGVPALIVAGRYRVLSGGVTSYDEMFQVVDFLVDKERSRRQKEAG